MPARIYKIAKPVATHTRTATCGEVDCTAQQNGFVIMADEATTLGQAQAHYLRTQSGRAHTETKVATLTTFTFPPNTVSASTGPSCTPSPTAAGPSGTPDRTHGSTTAATT